MKTMLPSNDHHICKRHTKIKRRRRLATQIFILSLGIILVSTGIYFLLYVEILYDKILQTAMSFDNGTAAYNAWSVNDPPLDLNIYLFNWTNPTEIRNPKVKPKFERLGPYVFKEGREKIDVVWNKNKTVSYKHKKYFEFNPEKTERSLDDEINIINPVPLAIGYQMRYKSYFPRKAVSFILDKFDGNLHVTEPVRKIIFEGFDNNILGALNVLSLGNIQDKFALFYNTNGATGYDGSYTMSYDTAGDFGSIDTWNYRNASAFFSVPCNDIKGSAGEFYPMHRDRTKIYLYSPELCRYAELEYDKDVIVKGIKGYKFTGRYLFDNGTQRPQNECFSNGEKIPSGMFNVSACRKDSPTFLSFPNFYNADPYYTDALDLDGIVSKEEDDEFYMVLEPRTGIVIEAAPRMQLNMLLQHINGINLYNEVPKVFLPIFYFEQKITIADELVFGILILQNMPEIIEIFALILIILGSVILLYLCASIYLSSAFHHKHKDIKTKDEDFPLKSYK